MSRFKMTKKALGPGLVLVTMAICFATVLYTNRRDLQFTQPAVRRVHTNNVTNTGTYQILARHIRSRGVPTSMSMTSIEVDPILLVPQTNVAGTNCSLLFDGDRKQLAAAKQYQSSHPKVLISDKTYVSWAANCSNFLKERQYIMHSLTKEEDEFPIAFSILMFKHVEQFERLLRTIYRPQNVYCVHVDKKASPSVQLAVRAITMCFENVFVASQQRDVRWGSFTNLEPEILCMRDLWTYKHWKYFINLTGQEVPLKTNWEMVQSLKLLKGGNAVNGFVKDANIWAGRWKLPGKAPFRHNITMAKGDVHVVLGRSFVNYTLHSHVAREFLDWIKDTHNPDETYFQSLYFSPQLGVPGAYTGPDFRGELHTIPRYKVWAGHGACGGKYVRAVCIQSTADLQHMAQRSELFVNKLHIEYEPLALDCMEWLVFERTRQELMGRRVFNSTVYTKQWTFTHHAPVHD